MNLEKQQRLQASFFHRSANGSQGSLQFGETPLCFCSGNWQRCHYLEYHRNIGEHFGLFQCSKCGLWTIELIFPFGLPQTELCFHNGHGIGKHSLIKDDRPLEKNPVLLVKLHVPWYGSAEICSKNLLLSKSRPNIAANLVHCHGRDE